MTAKSVAYQTGFKRCAVCKIDLKGRFVYVDEETEQLLGYTKEELFGKPIFDFVSESSADLIEKLVTYRNHYESFFDATKITVISRDKKNISTDAIVSLNFIAGNPVNYQIILNTTKFSISDRPTDDNQIQYQEFLTAFLKLNMNSEPDKLSELLNSFTQSETLITYSVRDSVITPLSASQFGSSITDDLSKLPLLTPLHSRLIDENKEFIFTDKSSVQLAIEKEGTAPNEYVVPIITEPNCGLLFRFIYPEDFKMKSAIKAIAKATLAVNLIEKTYISSSITKNEQDAPSEQAIDIKFTIGFLDTLKIGALLVNENGQISGFNNSFLFLSGAEKIDGDYQRFLELLDKKSKTLLSDNIPAYFSEELDDADPQDYLSGIIFKNGIEADLTIIRFGIEAGNCNSCFVFTKKVESSISASSISNSGSINEILFQTVSEHVKNIAETANKFAHGAYESAGKQQKKKLSSLISQTDQLDSLIATVLNFHRNIESSSELTEINLNLLIEQTARKLKKKYPNKTLILSNSEIPPILSNDKALRWIIYEIISNSIKFSQHHKLHLDIKGIIRNNQFNLTLIDDGPGIPKEKIDAIFKLKTEENGLALSSYLVSNLQGKMVIASMPNRGVKVEITLPIIKSKEEKNDK